MILERDALQQRMKCVPPISQLLERPEVLAQLSVYPRPLVLQVLREEVDALREEIKSGKSDLPLDRSAAAAQIEARLATRIAAKRRGKLRRVLNATGVVLNTNLGRAPLCQRALDRIVEVAHGYTNLEIQLDTRQRGGRMAGIQDLLQQLTGAPSAYVVNNNAAAVLLALATMAPGKEVIISRGELIEIGGSFRIPEVMEAAGVILREVGTTNRTHLRDYEQAIGPQTGLLLKVHQSNYTISGFTSAVELSELVTLGQRHAVPVMVDWGSGSLLDLVKAGLPFVRSALPSPIEPTLAEIVQTGVDVVTCSGDKLLGGPQAGILLGQSPWIQAAARQPLTRALRVDKLTLAALEATLQVYAEEGDGAVAHIPVWTQLTHTIEVLQAHGDALLRMIGDCEPLRLSLEPAIAAVGGGALPAAQLPTIRLAIQHPTISTEALEYTIRTQPLPIVGLLDRGRLMLDLRTLHPSDFPEVAVAIRALVGATPTAQSHAMSDGE